MVMDQRRQEGSAAVKATMAAGPATWRPMTVETGQGPGGGSPQSNEAMADTVASAGRPHLFPISPFDRPPFERSAEDGCINDALLGWNYLAGYDSRGRATGSGRSQIQLEVVAWRGSFVVPVQKRAVTRVVEEAKRLRLALHRLCPSTSTRSRCQRT